MLLFYLELDMYTTELDWSITPSGEGLILRPAALLSAIGVAFL